MPELGTKRGNGHAYETEDYKRSKQDDGALKLRMLVAGRYCGALIGKGGENFKKLREQYNVRITGLSSRANERVLQLDGDRESCISIVKELLPTCSEGPYPAQNDKCTYELNILVNTDQAGSLIGKGGSKMKEIQEQTNGKLKVYQDCLPNSNERVVALGGEDESRITAILNTVLDVLSSHPSRTQTSYYEPGNTAAPLVSTMPSPGAMMGQNMNMNPMNVPSEVNFAALLVANRDNFRGTRDPSTDFGQVQTVTTMTVPNDMCGAIIGKGGMNIKEVRQTSGAKIDFTKSEAGSKEDRTITMTGTQEQIQIAEQMMCQYVRSSSSIHRNAQQQFQQM